MWHMQHNSYVCTLYIYMTIDIYIYTYMCMCVCMCMYCYVWLPSSLLPASFQHPYSILFLPASFQPPSSLLPASSQPPPSLLPASIINLFWYIGALIIYLFLYICALAINPVWYIYMCIHHPSSVITYMHWSSICMVGLSHSLIQWFLFCLPRTHVGALSADTKDVYPVCIALHVHIMPYDRLVFVELHMYN